MENEAQKIYKESVHAVLAHSYATYFVLFLVGVTLDILFKIKIFSSAILLPTGALCLVFGTLLIFWSQKTSRELKKENITHETFYKGPYRFSRSPTHWGLFFLMLGFGIIVNAVFVVITTIISFVVSRKVFLSKEEEILKRKYGEPYLSYQRKVRL